MTTRAQGKGAASRVVKAFCPAWTGVDTQKIDKAHGKVILQMLQQQDFLHFIKFTRGLILKASK